MPNKETNIEICTLSEKKVQKLSLGWYLFKKYTLYLLFTTMQGRSHHFKSGGKERLVLYLFFSVNPCLIDRFYYTFLPNMFYGCIIIYDYKTEGKKERKKDNSLSQG